MSYNGLNGLLNQIKTEYYLTEGLWLIGKATHPVQDKWGHNDDYQEDKADIWASIPGFLMAGYTGLVEDQVKSIVDPANGIKYEHFDDVIRSRDETYSILGRFYKEYKEVINKI